MDAWTSALCQFSKLRIMTRLVRTAAGIGRVLGDNTVGESVEIFTTEHGDLAALFADGSVSSADAPTLQVVSLADVEPLRPVVDPKHVVIVGLNYHAHAAEVGLEAPSSPMFAVCDGGPNIVTEWNHDIVLPADAPTKVDYECELGLIVGTGGRDIAAADAWAHVGGLLVINDVSARDVQDAARANRTPNLGLAKTSLTFKPAGSIVYTPDEFNVDGLDMVLTTKVNGEQRQRGSLDDLVFGVPEIIEAVSARVELEPGDLICTGTPGGVGLATGVFLKAGDVVEITIERLGTIRNTVR
ncbi:MAG: 2-keto-4-pentenoate hydratase/2-oxohepta-3-ene-1,7-dioic acid hydratase in catechol pathway [Candidatus Poriferisodalaceae bacterium]|jgi:2-keto-4-pentenoate hydratase/2-oxohepta-3-ene-1,7-dioic acid hydratase in catechol pathway